MRTDKHHLLLPPAGQRSAFWLAVVAAFVVIVALLLLLPRGSAAGDPVAGAEVSVDLTPDVTLRLLPELHDQGWRATHDSHYSDGYADLHHYALDIHATVDNSGTEDFPRYFNIHVREQPESGHTRNLSTRWFGRLQTMVVPAGTQAASYFAYYFHNPCGQFLAVVTYWPGGDATGSSTVEVPFRIDGPDCAPLPGRSEQ